MFASVDFSVYTLLARVANLAVSATGDTGQTCTLAWLGVVLGFPCERITPIATGVVAMAAFGVVIVWAVKHLLDEASEITVTLKRPRKK